MEHTESSKKENNSNEANANKDWKITPSLQAYVDARNAFVEKYAIKSLPKWNLA